MISEYAHFDKNGLEVEVNWDEKSKPCKEIKFKIGGQEAIIPNGDFFTMMMIFGTPEQQEALIPIKETKVRAVTSLLKIRAKKDIRQGEIIAVPHTYFVSSSVYEKIKLEGSGDAKLDRDVKKIGAVKKPETDYREKLS